MLSQCHSDSFFVDVEIEGLSVKGNARRTKASLGQVMPDCITDCVEGRDTARTENICIIEKIATADKICFLSHGDESPVTDRYFIDTSFSFQLDVSENEN